MERGNSIQTLLLTDVVGSTRLWTDHPRVMPAIIECLEELAEAAVGAQGGELVKKRGEGDSLFCVMPNPAAAARAAAGLIRSLRDQSFSEEVKIHVRAAIHCGSAQTRGADLFGSMPNRCARLREVGHGDQILLSGAARAQIASGDGIAVRELGRHRLRDLDEPEAVYQVLAEGLPNEFPPLRSLTCLRNNLPTQYTSFVGREALRRELLNRLHHDRLITLTGAGGSGKTRLALQVGAESIEAFPDGVWFVELAELSTETAIVRAIGDACGHRDLPDRDAPESLAGRLAAHGRALFLVDNAEHALGPTGRVIATLLGAVPDLRVFVTSREPLRLRGERVYRLPPLAVPPAGCAEPEIVVGSEAGALFLDRARLRLPEFQIRESNAKAVGDIVRRLDGIPLCLEMAASHIGYLGPDQIANRLHDRFSLLDSDSMDAPPRHRTMRETIAWQYDTLSEGEKILLQRLAVFAGGFTLEAAEAVGGEPPLDPDSVLRHLRALVDKSLVVATPDGGEMRYRLLETIAQFASDQPEDETDKSLSSLFAWALSLAEASYLRFYLGDNSSLVATLDQAEASINRAIQYGLSQNDRRVCRLIQSMSRYWHFRGRFLHARALLDQALKLCDDPSLAVRLSNASAVFSNWLGDQIGAISVLERTLEAMPQGTPGVAGLMTNLGNAYDDLGDGQRAVEIYQAAAELAEIEGDGHVVRITKFNVAQSLARLEDTDRAYEMLTRLCDENRAQGDLIRVAMCHLALAGICHQRLDRSGCAHHLALAFDIVGTTMSAQMLLDAIPSAAWLAAEANDLRSTAFLLGGHTRTLAATKMKIPPPSRRILDDLMQQALGALGREADQLAREGQTASADLLSQTCESICKKVRGPQDWDKASYSSN